MRFLSAGMISRPSISVLLDGVCDLFTVHHHVVQGVKAFGFLNAEAACQISLWITVDHKNSDFARCQCSREIDQR